MNMKHLLPVLRAFLLLFLTTASYAAVAPSSPTYVLPARVDGVRQPVMLLNGTWQFRYSPKSRWTRIEVPGEAAMQGYAVEHDKPFVYRKSLSVPADFAGQTLILRFDGVYSQAKLYLNGQFVREHFGGFSRWDTDVTSYVRPGKNVVELEVTDRLDDMSYASGYAHHTIGGILRDVTLFALPKTHLRDFNVETRLDSLYQDATLALSCTSVAPASAEVKVELTAPNGTPVPLAQNRFPLQSGEQSWQLPISKPLKWDAEHPNLYTLTVTVWEGSKETSRFTRQVGFRDIKVVGDRLLVNGSPVKLRGACRHDIHPTLGRTTTAELDSLDAIRFKQSNMNFVRTSHYPPTERFLSYCDRYGIYVECETAVCFVNTHRQKNYAPANSQDNPEFTHRYLGQFQEMVKSFRTHASVLLWSVGNESDYGNNFKISYDWAKETDPTRPVIFSYPGSAKKEKIYDLLSMHYQDAYGNLNNQWGMSTRGFEGHGIPALFDEWAHPACYTYATLQNDPNIREFWGKSLDMMWSGLYDSRGGLGGAIWGYIDETFALPEPKVGTPFWKTFAHTAKPQDYQGNCVGYGEWGIVDVWRREKPEFWSTKKAYSPIRLMADQIEDFTPGQRIALTVYNRFDHTNLSEIQASYTYKGTKKTLSLPSAKPRQKGMLVLPAEQWEAGQYVQIEFSTPSGELIDAYRPVLGAEKITYPATLTGETLTVQENDSLVIIQGNGFEVPFSKKSGLITRAKVGEEVLIKEGPFLHLYINFNHLSGAEVRKAANHMVTSEADWIKSDFSYQKKDDGVYVHLSGSYKGIATDFHIKVTSDGQLDMNYLCSNVPNGYLRETGLAFHLSDDVKQLDWKRKGYWNYYPEGDFAGNEGSTSLYNAHKVAYGQAPNQPWQADTHNYFYWADAGANCKQPLTQMAKGMKENIYWYSLSTPSHQLSVTSSDASTACRIHKSADEQLTLYTNNRWDYPEIAWGNYCKRLEVLPCYGQIKMGLK